MANEPHTELGVCYVPNVHQDYQEPLPTKLSWQAAAAINIAHVRMDYRADRLRYFDPAFRLARDGGMHITGNMTFDDPEAATPDAIEAQSFDMVQHYGQELEAVSFGNEFGGLPGMSPQAAVLDISQGGTYDFIREVIGPRLLAFMRGARRANPGIMFDLFDADSVEVQQRSMELLIGTEFENDPKIRWCVHNYADIEILISKRGQDYSSMAGMNGKPGFLSLFEDPRFMTTVEVPPPPPGSGTGGFTNLRRPRGWYISENGKSTGPFGGIATDSDMDIMIAFSRMMLTTYPQCGKIDWGSPKFFFTRVPAPPGVPPGTWCTWTFGEPVASAKGRELAGLFAPDPIKKAMPVPGRKPGQGSGRGRR